MVDAEAEESPHQPKPRLLIVLVVVVAAECALMAGLTVLLCYELLVDRPDSLATAVAILILTALAAVWLGVVAAKTWAGRSWVRGAIVFWQVLQAAVGVTSLQGLLPRQDIGWMLIIPAVAALVLVLMPSVTRATTH